MKMQAILVLIFFAVMASFFVKMQEWWLAMMQFSCLVIMATGQIIRAIQEEKEGK